LCWRCCPGELAVVPSLKVPMNDEVDTKILFHDPLRVVMENEQLAERRRVNIG
jgi:hypothetical protein